MRYYEKWKQYQNYVIIAVVSLIALFFLPMLGTQMGLGWVLPTTFAGWVVYSISKLLVATINILIFHCFVQQGKINIATHPNFLEALTILGNIEPDAMEAPRSPQQFLSGIYGKKGVTIFITSALSAVGLTQAILTFDLVSMLTYLFTIVLGIVFGLLQMSQVEIYWTEEYLSYAKERKRKDDQKREESLSNPVENVPTVCPPQTTAEGNDTTDTTGGTSLLESVAGDGPSCDNN
jgi:hypothetical protein